MKSKLFYAVISLWMLVYNTPAYLYGQENTTFGTFQYKDTTSILQAIQHAREIADTFPDQAKAILHSTLGHSKRLSFGDGIALSFTEYGRILMSQGHYQESVNNIQLALKYCKSEGYLWYIFNNLGNAYNHLGQLEQASTAYFKAIAYMPQKHSGVVPICYVYTNFCSVLYQLRQYDKALLYIDKALPIAKEEKQYDAYANLLGLKALNYFYQKDYTKAEVYFDSALKFSRKNKDYRNEYNILMNKGNFYLKINKPEKSLDVLLEAKEVMDNNYLSVEATSVFLDAIGAVYLRLKRYKEAEHYLLQIQALADSGKMPKMLLSAKYHLSELYRATGKTGKAFSYLRDYMSLKDSLQGKEAALAISDMETRYRTAEKDKEIVQNKLLISTQQSKINRKNLWIAVIAGSGGMLILLFLWFYFFLRQKNKLLLSRQKIAELHAKIEGEEEERRRIAQELHDGVNSQLVGVKGCLSTIGHLYPEVAATAHFDMAHQILDSTSADLRNTAHNLWPLAITQKGLANAIYDFCAQLSKNSGVHIEFHAYGSFDELEAYLLLNIFRMVQELLHNVVKHASATEAIVLLNEHPNEISLIVEDNGTGITPDKMRAGSGLTSIKKRVAVHSGNIQIEPAASGGTIVSIFLNKSSPVKNEHLNIF